MVPYLEEDAASDRVEETILFFTKNFHKVQMFCEKDKKSTMLPQAEPFCIGANARFATLLRRFCYLKGIALNRYPLPRHHHQRNRQRYKGGDA